MPLYRNGGGGGSDTPWTEDHDAATYSLDDVGSLSVGADGASGSSLMRLGNTRTNTGGGTINGFVSDGLQSFTTSAVTTYRIVTGKQQIKNLHHLNYK